MTTQAISAPPDAAAAGPGAHEALAEGELAIVLPPGLDPEDLVPTPETSEPIEPAPAPAPTPATPVPSPVPAPARRGNPAIALQRMRQEIRALRRENQQLRAQPPAALPAMSDKDWQDLEPKVEAASSTTAGQRLIWEHAERKAEAARMAAARNAAIVEQQREIQERVQRSQEAFRSSHPLYDERLIRSGVLDEFKEGGDLTRRIVTSDDPAAAAYAEATARLKDWGDLDEDEEPAAPPPATLSPTPARPAVVAEPQRVPAPALSPAAARVVEEMARTPAPPRGIRTLPSAGGPARAAMTPAQLFALRDTNPGAFVDLLKANPELERRYLGG